MHYNTIKAQVEKVSPLTDSIIELILTPEKYIDYFPGQYLQIHCGEEALCFSIANAPLGSQKYELHIRHQLGNPYEQPLFSQIKQKGEVTLSLPYGNCHIARLNKDKPLVFIAAGTGFAPVKAMIEYLLATGDQRLFELYWGARSQSDLYMDDKVSNWQEHVKNFSYASLLSGSRPKAFIHTLLQNHAENLSHCQIVLAGSFDMVYALRDALVSHGVPQQQLFSDAFDFE